MCAVVDIRRKSLRSLGRYGKAVVVVVVQLVTVDIVARALSAGDTTSSGPKGLIPRVTSAPVDRGAMYTTACVVIIILYRMRRS